jgi:hypothetical protein
MSTQSLRWIGVVVPALVAFGAWLFAHLMCVISGIAALLLVLFGAGFAACRASVRARTQPDHRFAAFLLALLAVTIVLSLFLPIWNPHPGLGFPPHSHYILDAAHIH